MVDSGDGSDDGPLTVLLSTRAVITLPDEEMTLSPATITMSARTGKIISVLPRIEPREAFPVGTRYVDYSPWLLLPGLVDAHVHLNEPGRGEWEGFWTGTRAAASGGVTTVVDMPLNSIPPTTSVAGLEEKLRASEGQCWVDVAYYAGVVPGNEAELRPLVEAGVRGFKAFLIDSGVDEFPAVSVEHVAAAMRQLKDSATVLMFHAEMEPSAAEEADGKDRAGGPTDGDPCKYETFLRSRPSSLEREAVEAIVSLAPTAPALALHIVHLSAVECIPILRTARARGVKITAETCPHYLCLTAEQVDDGDTRYKCCPPIRGQMNRRQLWDELVADDSCIRTVVSDHSPCSPPLKLLQELQGRSPGEQATAEEGIRGDFMAAWGGIASVGLGLSILHSAAQQMGPEGWRQLTIVDLVRLCCRDTARQAGLEDRKGALKAGMDADICLFDPAEAWTVGERDTRWKHACSPWLGHRFSGRVRATWLRGRKLFELGGANGGFVPAVPFGRSLTEKRCH